MMSEASPVQKDKYYIMLLIENKYSMKIHSQKTDAVSRASVGWGAGFIAIPEGLWHGLTVRPGQQGWKHSTGTTYLNVSASICHQNKHFYKP